MTLARFTPSLIDGETLERLFVHRDGLLDDVLARIEAAALSDERRHRLFVGPRGAGKTHLISLVHHRAVQAQAAGLSFRLSWLLEDPWEIESYDDLLEQIIEQVEPPAPRGDGSVETQLLRAADGSPIVVLFENLDQILAAIGRDGQQRLRALLENKRPLLLIATSTRLSDDLLSQTEPFYGFFDTTQLQPFSVDQAADMLAAIAEVTDKPALGALLRTPVSRARLATIDHLAGGQPRVWALLGTGLSSTGIDEMVEMLLSRFDDLTPYYQEQLARLSPNEAKVVRRLADADRPLTVSALGELSRIDPKSVAKTVSDLRRKGWVRQHRSILTEKVDARLRYYELAEPLARIAFQVKAAHGAPVRLVVDFLATWYTAEQLACEAGDIANVDYRLAAQVLASGPTARVRAVLSGSEHLVPPASGADVLDVFEALDDALHDWENGSAEALLAQPAALSGLMAQKLREMPAGYLRMELARLAFLTGGGRDWSTRLHELAATPDRLVRAEALLLLAAVRSTSALTSPDAAATLVALADVVPELEQGEAHRLIAGSAVLLRTLQFEHRLALLASLDAGLSTGQAWRAVQQQRIAAQLGLRRDDDAMATARPLARETKTHEGAASEAHLNALGLLGMAEGSADRFDRAAQTFRELAACSAQLLGADTRQTLHARWMLSLALRRAGDEGFGEVLRQLGEDCDRVLGESDTLTGLVRSDLETLMADP